MEGTVTLSKEEYDRLREIAIEHNLRINSPEEFVKIEYPEYNRWQDDEPRYNEIRIYSGEPAIQRLKAMFDNQLKNLKESYDRKLEEASKLQERYKDIIEAVDNFKRV